jgi:hypothetical protein
VWSVLSLCGFERLDHRSPISIRARRQRWRLSGGTGELILGLHLDQQIDDGADQARRLAGFVAAHAGGHGIERIRMLQLTRDQHRNVVEQKVAVRLSRGDQDERAATIRMRIRRRSIGMIVAG